jgi:hypothetical protein
LFSLSFFFLDLSIDDSDDVQMFHYLVYLLRQTY